MTEWPDSLKAFFFAFWAIIGNYYGEVHYIAHQHSIFTTELEALRPKW